jgi:hypothetical protein
MTKPAATPEASSFKHWRREMSGRFPMGSLMTDAPLMGYAA